MTDRAVTPVLGIVLLLGLTTVAALSLLVVSATVFDGSQSAAETNQAERSLSEFAATADRLAGQGGGDADFQVRGSDDGSIDVDPDAGSYEVRIERPSGTDVLTSGDLGAYRYLASDGTVVAYQGGGVWRQDPRGDARIRRPPEFHYRSTPEPTLTLPVVRVEGASSTTAPVHGRMDVSRPETRYPRRPTHRNPLDSGTVYIQIGSEYCAGWETFFRERTDGAIAETCEETGETTEDEILVHLTVPFSFEGMGGDAVITESYTNTGGGAGGVSGDVEEGPHSMESVSGVVDARVQACADGEGDPVTPTIDDPGLYCANSLAGGTYHFETDGGDVEVAVNGEVNPDEITITGDGNVTIFANGSVLQNRATPIGNDSHPERLRFMVSSGEDVGWNGAGNSQINAFIYAPNSEVDFHGNVDITGGVVADTVELGGNAEIYGHPTVTNLGVQFDQGGEPFYYLHVSEATVEVDD